MTANEPAPIIANTNEDETTYEAADAAAPVTVTAANYDVTRHDGCVTITSPRTGDHRTFRVRTVQSGNLAGKRIVGLLTGSNNEADYTGFAFADDYGVHVWRKYRDSGPWATYAKMLEQPSHYAALGAEYLIEARCRKCGRKLTDDTSIREGLGPHCGGRV